MDVTCPACAARYTADEQKLRGKTARMRCKACDTVWLVSGPENSPSESKRAAIVKRGAEREHRDLFASRPLDIGSVKQTLRPPPPDDSPMSGVAARNEASVLFTVDALRGNARLKTPDPEPSPISGFMVDDDEGIIDLNALASSPPKVGSRNIAPLFSEPPPAAFTADVSDTGMGQAIAMPGGFRLSKRAIAGIAAAAVALVLCAIGLSAAFKGEEPVAHSAATMIVPPPVVAAPTPPPAAPTPEPVAAASSDDEPKTPGARRNKSGGKRSSGPKASFAPTKVQSSGVPVNGTGVAKTVPKASDKCGCKGDFNCILRCTATGK
jgi:predicted Zn finger-like uncharacterized protein